MIDHNEEMDYTPDIFTLSDEDGNEHVFELLDSMTTEDGESYYAFVPYYEDPEAAVEADNELIVLKGEIVDGEEMMATIDDEAEYERIGNLFLERINEMFEEEFDEDASEEE